MNTLLNPKSFHSHLCKMGRIIPSLQSVLQPGTLWLKHVKMESIIDENRLDRILDFQGENSLRTFLEAHSFLDQSKETKRKSQMLALHILLFVYKNPYSPPPLGVWLGGWGRTVRWNHRAPKRQGSNQWLLFNLRRYRNPRRWCTHTLHSVISSGQWFISRLPATTRCQGSPKFYSCPGLHNL